MRIHCEGDNAYVCVGVEKRSWLPTQGAEGTHVCVCGRVRGPPRGGERAHVCMWKRTWLRVYLETFRGTC